MGAAPIGWQDLIAWQSQTGIALQPWEARIIRQASREYVSQMAEAMKPECPPPGKVIEKDPLKLAKHIKNILR
jgi:hypothetical protein